MACVGQYCFSENLTDKRFSFRFISVAACRLASSDSFGILEGCDSQIYASTATIVYELIRPAELYGCLSLRCGFGNSI